jgi:hypothetical protein
MIFLLLSFVLAALMHSYVVFYGRQKHPETLSTHAVLSSNSLLVYRLGHAINGGIIGLMVYSAFLGGSYDSWVILATFLAVLSEWAQAVIPAKGKTDVAHTIIAALMAYSMLVLVAILTIDFAANNFVFWFNIISLLVVLSFTFHVRYPPRSYFWKLQLVGQSVLYFNLFLLLQ